MSREQIWERASGGNLVITIKAIKHDDRKQKAGPGSTGSKQPHHESLQASRAQSTAAGEKSTHGLARVKKQTRQEEVRLPGPVRVGLGRAGLSLCKPHATFSSMKPSGLVQKGTWAIPAAHSLVLQAGGHPGSHQEAPGGQTQAPHNCSGSV